MLGELNIGVGQWEVALGVIIVHQGLLLFLLLLAFFLLILLLLLLFRILLLLNFLGHVFAFFLTETLPINILGLYLFYRLLWFFLLLLFFFFLLFFLFFFACLLLLLAFRFYLYWRFSERLRHLQVPHTDS